MTFLRPNPQGRVALAGRGYSSISDALVDARDGETIQISDGVYAERLYVNRDVKLVARGSAVSVTAAGNQPVIRTAGTVELLGLAVVLEAPAANTAAIEVESGRLLLDHCAIQSACAGVVAVGEGLELSIRNSRFSGLRDTAVCYAGGATGVFEGNVITDCQTVGLMVVGAGTRPLIRSNHISRTGMFGIQVLSGASPRIEENVIEDTTGSGIVFDHPNTQAHAARNRITRPRGVGIEVGNAAKAQIIENHVAAPAMSGFSFYGKSAKVEAAGNTVTGAIGNGFQVVGGCQAILERNTVEGSGNYGIVVAQPGTYASIRTTTVSESSNYGVFIDGGADAILEHSTVTGTTPSVAASGAGSRILAGNNRLTNSRTRAPVVLVLHGASAELAENDFWGDFQTAVTVVGSRAVLAARNRVHSAEGEVRAAGILEVLNEAALKSDTLPELK